MRTIPYIAMGLLAACAGNSNDTTTQETDTVVLETGTVPPGYFDYIDVAATALEAFGPHLDANSVWWYNEQFELPAGESVILVLDAELFEIEDSFDGEMTLRVWTEDADWTAECYMPFVGGIDIQDVLGVREGSIVAWASTETMGITRTTNGIDYSFATDDRTWSLEDGIGDETNHVLSTIEVILTNDTDGPRNVFFSAEAN